MVTDRKNKRHFCAGASGVRPPEHPGTACQRTPLALVVHAPRAGRRSTASLVLDMRRRTGYGRTVRGDSGGRPRERRFGESCVGAKVQDSSPPAVGFEDSRREVSARAADVSAHSCRPPF